jgi:hypothetical protein
MVRWCGVSVAGCFLTPGLAECCSVSTDGQLLWWDIRKLNTGPSDSMLIRGATETLFGCTTLEYRTDAGATRYLMGTEQGQVRLQLLPVSARAPTPARLAARSCLWIARRRRTPRAPNP